MRALMLIAVMMVGCGPVESSPIPGNECDIATAKYSCAVDGKVTGCVMGCAQGEAPPCQGYVWQQYPCAACRAGQPLPNCNPDSGLCACD